METHDWPIILKYVGSIIAGFYGLYATVTDFHVERDGRRVLLKRGYFGIALLGLSTVLSLTVDVMRDRREAHERALERRANDARRAEEDRARRLEAEARERADERLRGLQRDQETVTRTLREQLTETQAMQSSLGTVTGRLSHVTQDVVKVSSTAREILRENLERVEDVEVVLIIDIDPSFFFRPVGPATLPTEIANELAESVRANEPIASITTLLALEDALRTNYDMVRHRVLQQWQVDIELHPMHGGRGQWVRRQGPDGIATFTIIGPSFGGKLLNGFECWVTYRITPSRLAGFRTFRDLNNATADFTLIASAKLVDLQNVRFRSGEGGERDLLFVPDLRRSRQSLVRDRWDGSLRFPSTYYFTDMASTSTR